jgi:hypothetical protein
VEAVEGEVGQGAAARAVVAGVWASLPGPSEGGRAAGAAAAPAAPAVAHSAEAPAKAAVRVVAARAMVVTLGVEMAQAGQAVVAVAVRGGEAERAGALEGGMASDLGMARTVVAVAEMREVAAAVVAGSREGEEDSEAVWVRA